MRRFGPGSAARRAGRARGPRGPFQGGCGEDVHRRPVEAKRLRLVGRLRIGSLVVSLVVGGGGVALGWLLAGGTTSTTGPGAEVQGACLAIRGTQLPTSAQGLSLAEADRWGGAGALAQAAGKGDGQYQALGAALDKVATAMREMDSLTQVMAAAELAQSLCSATFH